MPMVPDEIRLAHNILRNAGCLPEEVERRKEIHRLEELLSARPDEADTSRLPPA